MSSLATSQRRSVTIPKSVAFNDDPDSFIIGDKVWVQGIKPGYIVYIGQVEFAKGDWAGVVLDKPEGKNDGMVHGVRYFQCPPKRGLFTRLHRLSHYPIDDLDINNNPSVYSKIKSQSTKSSQTTPTRLSSTPTDIPYIDISTSETPTTNTQSTVKTHRLCTTDGRILTTVTRVTKSPANMPHYALPTRPTKVITTVTTTTTTLEKPKSVLKGQKSNSSTSNTASRHTPTPHVHFGATQI